MGSTGQASSGGIALQIAEFLAEDEMIDINPMVRSGVVTLVRGDFGPFEPSITTQVWCIGISHYPVGGSALCPPSAYLRVFLCLFTLPFSGSSVARASPEESSSLQNLASSLASGKVCGKVYHRRAQRGRATTTHTVLLFRGSLITSTLSLCIQEQGLTWINLTFHSLLSL